MNPENVFKRYDIRGRYPEEIDEKFAERIGKSLGKFVKDKREEKVVVTRDNKQSSKKLFEEAVKGLEKAGIKVLTAGKGPTDYTAFCCQKKDAYGIQVTSSHLPRNFNGFKFIYPEGNSFENHDLEKLRENFRENSFKLEKGGSETANLKQSYIEKFRDFVGETPERKIVWDSMGGSSSNFIPQLIEETGFELIEIERKEIPRKPDPKPENLEKLAEKVEEENAFLGFANDLDADRVTVYRRGEFIKGDSLIGVFTRMLNPVNAVVSVDTSETVLEKLEDTEFLRTRVGDPFVLGRMVEENADFSAEPNGHYCFPGFVNYNSGIMAGILAASTDPKFFQEFEDLQVREFSFKIRRKSEKMREIKAKVEKNYETVSEVDGIKFRAKNCSVLVRPSGTSQKIRVKIEGENSGELEKTLKPFFNKA